MFLCSDSFTSSLINFNNFERMLFQACVVGILLFAASDAQIFDVGRFDIADTISQAEGALADVQELQQAEVLGLGQEAFNAADAAIGDVQQANGGLGLEQAFGVADATLKDVQQSNGDFGLGQAFDGADSGLGDSQVQQANGLEVRKQASDVLGHADSVGAATSSVRQRTSGGALGQRRRCRLERSSGRAESNPGECFKEPECREECDTRGGDGRKCTVANERACTTLQEQAS